MPKTKKNNTAVRTVNSTAAGLTRRRGRPPASENSLLDKKLIMARAFEMAKNTPLQELSIVRVARELGVTPALIHYYLNGRDDLTAGVMNAFYGEMLTDWPSLTGRWREDITAAAHQVYTSYVRRAGIAAYVVAYNRFRIVGVAKQGEPDYGTLFFERFLGGVREAGFDAQRTSMYALLLVEFVISGAYATVRHRLPGDHGDLIEHALALLDPKDFPNTLFVHKNYSHVDARHAFEEGLNLMLGGLELARSRLVVSQTVKVKRAVKRSK